MIEAVRSARRGVLLLMGIALVSAAACVSGGTGTPTESASRTIAVDSSALLSDLRTLAADSMEGRLVGSEGGARARRFLIRRLAQIGVQPVGADYSHPFGVVRRDSTRVQGVNLMAQIPGTRNPGRRIVLTAHYDHLGTRDGQIFHGADDNASGVAAALALAEHFRRNPLRATLVIALLDAEEGGLRGARALVADPPFDRGSIALNVNLDMVSNSQRGELYAAGATHYPALRPHLEAVASRAPVRLLLGHDTPVPQPVDDWTMQSDHGAFHEVGIPFVYFGVEDHPYYHKPTDTFESITPGFYVDAVRTIADAVETLDRALPAISPPS